MPVDDDLFSRELFVPLVAVISFLNAGGNGSTRADAGADASVKKAKSDKTASVALADRRIDELRVPRNPAAINRFCAERKSPATPSTASAHQRPHHQV